MQQVKVATVAAVNVNTKKSFFESSKSQNLFIALTRLPKAAEFLRAVDNLNEKMVSQDNLGSLLKNWPADEMDELMSEASAAGPDAEWETTEAFFITLGAKKKF